MKRNLAQALDVLRVDTVGAMPDAHHTEADMSSPVESKRSLPFSLRVKIAVISLLSLLITTACSLLRLRSNQESGVVRLKVSNPTDTVTPYVMCYEVSLPADTPTPVCYTPTPPPLFSSHTPTPTLTPTPLCYTPTPSPVTVSPDAAPALTPAKVPPVMCYVPREDVGPVGPGPVDVTVPVPTPSEARRLLLEELLAKGRFPDDVANGLEG
jgi:hypothetical protein